MQYKQRVLFDDEIQNVDKVKAYITKSFSKRKPKKSNKLYINLCNIYEVYPQVVEEVLDNIPKLGYYKDYFHVLSFANNYALKNYIYNIVITQINEDMKNMALGKGITTMGKWLPSEGSKINKKINFIDNFNKLFWTKENKLTKFTLRKKYRQMKTQLNEKIGTLQSLMCTQQYDKINFDKVSHNALQRHKHHLINHEELVPKLKEHEMHIINKMSLYEFVKELFSENYDIKVLEEVWKNQTYHLKIPYLNQLISNTICVIDLSKDSFMNNAHFISIGLALLVNKFSTLKNNVIVCNNNIIRFNDGDSLLDMKNHLIKYSGPSKSINPQEYKKIIGSEDDYTLLFVTNKHIDVNINSTVLQIIPYYDNNYDVMMTTNGKQKKITKYEVSETTGERIGYIINKAPEFRTTEHVNYIIGIAMLWCCLKLYEFLFIVK